MPAEAARLTLSVPGRIDALEPCRRALLDFLAPQGLGPQAIYNIELVLEETLSNLISHGRPDAREHRIDLGVEVLPDRVLLSFEDDGPAFDPRRAVAPAAPASIDRTPIGGRGLLLVRRAACSIDYERAGGRNRLTIGVART
jgi:serine/threonine-protein kinase RsbW